ncbi:MAG: hypothetical protein AVDCRST_MAG54-906, partial [uncultured Actinomycetospora sp.]
APAGAGRTQWGAGGARGGGHREDGAAGAGPRGRRVVRVPGGVLGRGGGGGAVRVRGSAPAVQPAAEPPRRAARPPAERAGGGVRAAGRSRTGPLPGGLGEPDPGGRGRR